MSDLHVRSTRYQLRVDEKYGRFDSPPPLDIETDACRMHLENGVLIVEMKEHHSTVDSARQSIEPGLRNWELHAALSRDHTWLNFDFDPSASIIEDRDAPPPKPGILSVNAHTSFALASFAALASPPVPVFAEYPRPPLAFKASSEVEIFFNRYQRAFWDDESQLLSVGYLCLSFLERSSRTNAGETPKAKNSSKKRIKAAAKYRIDLEVLNELGTIVSEVGDLREARKLGDDATLRSLTPNERIWVREATKSLIRRMGEFEHDPDNAPLLPEITMRELPSLE
jgi:hypothetical protein